MAQDNSNALATVRDNQMQVYGSPMDTAKERWLAHTTTKQVVDGMIDSFVKDIHIMTQPQWPKPLLLLPGMDEIQSVLGVYKEMELVSQIEQWDGMPFFMYRYKATLRDRYTGGVVSQGYGMAHTKESGYVLRGNPSPEAQMKFVLNQVHKVDAVAQSRALRDAVFTVAPIRRRFEINEESVARDFNSGSQPPADEPQVSKPEQQPAPEQNSPKHPDDPLDDAAFSDMDMWGEF